MITRIGHIALNPLNMERSLDFYCSVLGFKKAFELYDDDAKPWIVYLKIDDRQFLEMFYGGIKDREEAYDFTKVGYNYMTININDINALAIKLEQKSVKYSIEDNHLCVLDPDGNLIDFVASPKDKKGIYSISFTVSDIKASLKFYCDQLGFKLRPDRLIEISQGVYIELLADGKGVNPSPVSEWHARGFQHLCLETDALYEDLAKLQALGVEVDQEPKTAADKNIQVWIHDPDGNKIELMQLEPDSPQAKA